MRALSGGLSLFTHDTARHLSRCQSARISDFETISHVKSNLFIRRFPCGEKFDVTPRSHLDGRKKYQFLPCRRTSSTTQSS